MRRLFFRAVGYEVSTVQDPDLPMLLKNMNAVSLV